ncbi:unnamed protein product [Didymodactylos carnosus]|uniref:Uncharacterized protein n=1 Tax=Didymodactylos carnosus TaxID=1234261 RepID=A0A8S2CPV5_9BILA|nr:unnamed protein product [Didymodactylos carnosus]CAF3553601.1 unnamed protein product [Didymodactylos carnosus]
MSTDNDVNVLKPYLEKIIKSIKTAIDQLKSKQQAGSSTTTTETPATSDDLLLLNSTLNTQVNTFSVDESENELLEKLTSEIQTTLANGLPHLSKICAEYLEDFLHSYNFDSHTRKFTSPLTMNSLHPFCREIEALHASLDAFPAAFNGDITKVKNFIKTFPMYKNRPGLWNTTLLYSAARNNKLELVQYLVDEAKCSVNAQNQRDLSYALDEEDPSMPPPRATAASTALHAACFNGHLDIVKFLVDHNADYYIRNQLLETPIMNALQSAQVKAYFDSLLTSSYSPEAAPENLRHEKTILDDDERPKQDCKWEYKPLHDDSWYEFKDFESPQFHEKLLPTAKFQSQFHLKVRQGLWSISLIEFNRSANKALTDHEAKGNIAWIRCRGSSILNFDCYCVWQIMLIKYTPPNQQQKIDSEPSLEFQHLPNTFNSQFKVTMKTWYYCDAKTNSLLDQAMNYRRKLVQLNIPFIATTEKVTFNLQEFSFANSSKNTIGYLRWLPKLISNTEQNKTKLVYLTNDERSTTNLDPMPLTTKRLEEVNKSKSGGTADIDMVAKNNEDENDRDDDAIRENETRTNDDDYGEMDENNVVSEF